MEQEGRDVIEALTGAGEQVQAARVRAAPKRGGGSNPLSIGDTLPCCAAGWAQDSSSSWSFPLTDSSRQPPDAFLRATGSHVLWQCGWWQLTGLRGQRVNGSILFPLFSTCPPHLQSCMLLSLSHDKKSGANLKRILQALKAARVRSAQLVR